MKRVYVVEDQPDLAEMLQLVLGASGQYQTTVFRDGLSAYRAVRDSRPDVLVADILLPSLNGLALTRLLKFDEAFANLPVLVMSSIFDSDIGQQARRCGADDFLPKPFEVPVFLERVERLLATRV